MRQQWDAAVAAASERPPADLAAAVAEELVALWDDLARALRRAPGRSWPAECDGLVLRIVMLSQLTAATPWPWVPASLLASGVYQEVLASAGIAFTCGCRKPVSPGQMLWESAVACPLLGEPVPDRPDVR